MQQRPLGPTEFHVSAIGLGGMPMSVPEQRPTEKQSIAVIHRAIELGITLIDTADSYCIDDTETGHNERLIGKALSQLPADVRSNVTVATKGGLVRPEGRWERCGTPDHLRQACEQSLKNLRVDAIDIYQFHAPDPDVPLGESLGELKLLQEQGKIKDIGVSNFSLAELEQAMELVSVASIQNQYSPTCRQPEKDQTLAGAGRHGIAFLPWSPLGGMRSAKQLGEGNAAIQQIGADYKATPQQLALAWLLAKGPHVIPIPGASRTESVEACVQAADLELSADVLLELDAAWAA